MSEWQFVPLEAHPLRPVARAPASVISGPKFFVSAPEECTLAMDDETCFDFCVSLLRPQCGGVIRSERCKSRVPYSQRDVIHFSNLKRNRFKMQCADLSQKGGDIFTNSSVDDAHSVCCDPAANSEFRGEADGFCFPRKCVEHRGPFVADCACSSCCASTCSEMSVTALLRARVTPAVHLMKI